MKTSDISQYELRKIFIMRSKLIFILQLLAVLWLAGCGPKNIVVLLPDPDGSVGRISVSNQAGSVEMETPNQAVAIKDDQTVPSAPYDIKKEKINAIFSGVIAIQPEPPVHFILYFKRDSTKLTSDSEKILSDIVASIKDKNSANISVIGHTDTAGDKNYNLNLSMRRAAAVSSLLVDRGIPQAHIQATSHGEENPLIKTEDNVNEPRNRRVEVVIR